MTKRLLDASLAGALVLAGLAVSQQTVAQDGPGAGDPALGERLYRTGIGADEEPVTAFTQGDLAIDGTQLTCVSCHRPSGIGSSEGGKYVPPITARHLFAPREATRELRNERFKEKYKELQTKRFYDDLRTARLRPAYDAASLARAITKGVDPADRALDPTMPRYALDEADAANLVAYLKTLSAADDPGVEPNRVHFATIVSDGVEPTRTDAFLATLRAFVEWYNQDISDDMSRPGFSPFYRSEFAESYRPWELHVWRLEGPESAWNEQLARFHTAQPVFAVISALTAGDFTPVADFCDAQAVPCLFPITDLPRTDGAENAYTLYFSRGLELEAETLVRYLANSSAAPKHIVQVYLDDSYGRRPASAFADAAAGELTETVLETVRVAEGADLAAAISNASSDAADLLVVWPGMASEAAVAALSALGADGPVIALPSNALDAARALLDSTVAERVLLTYPYDRPTASHPDSYRARAWVRSRRVPIADWDMQRQAYFALKMTEWAMHHLLTDYHRDYLIEIIEHEVENAFDPGPHPKLALGPGQRFGSKGAYVMRFEPEAKDGIVPVSGWIVP